MRIEIKRNVDRLLSLAVMGSAVVLSNSAIAQDLSTSISTAHANIATLPNLISGGCYIIGAGLVGAGLLKLKQYSEAPNQVKITEGLGRIVIGACLLAAPAITGWIESSVASTGTALGATGLSSIN